MHKVCFNALAVHTLSDTLGSSTLPSSIYNHDRVDRACLYASRRHKMHGSLVVLFDQDKPILLSKTRLLVKSRLGTIHTRPSAIVFGRCYSHNDREFEYPYSSQTFAMALIESLYHN